MAIGHRGRYVTLCLLALAVGLWTAGCGRKGDDASGKMVVVASIVPMADFSRKVGGEHVEVDLLVPPGASPHTYQPGPDQMKMLSKASVLVLNGIGIEFWADSVIDAANNPKLIVVCTSDGVDVQEDAAVHNHEHEHGHGCVHEAGNPHVWLDPILAVHQVEAIRDAFIKADPDHAADYRHNAEDYIAELHKLDADIRAEVATFASKQFIAFHPAWIYFAKRYGLTQAAVVEQSPGKEPSPKDIAKVVQTAKRLRAKAIFAEPQFSPKAANVVAEEAGAKVLELNPLGNPPDCDYIETMRANLATMAEALR